MQVHVVRQGIYGDCNGRPNASGGQERGRLPRLADGLGGSNSWHPLQDFGPAPVDDAPPSRHAALPEAVLSAAAIAAATAAAAAFVMPSVSDGSDESGMDAEAWHGGEPAPPGERERSQEDGVSPASYWQSWLWLCARPLQTARSLVMLLNGCTVSAAAAAAAKWLIPHADPGRVGGASGSRSAGSGPPPHLPPFAGAGPCPPAVSNGGFPLHLPPPSQAPLRLQSAAGVAAPPPLPLRQPALVFYGGECETLTRAHIALRRGQPHPR